MKIPPVSAIALAFVSLSLPACHDTHAADSHTHQEEHQKIIVTTPLETDVVVTQQFVAMIRAKNYIEVRGLEEGYLEAIPIKEGQAVKAGDVLFSVIPTLYQAKLDADMAEAEYARLKLVNTERLHEQKVVSIQEVNLVKAEWAKAEAKAKQARAELNFATVRAQFDGFVDRLAKQQGSLIKKEDILTTLSDNSTMWVYFNVPEARYFEFKSRDQGSTDNSRIKLKDTKIQLKLAHGEIFNQDAGDTVTVEGQFNPETGNIAFRADFPNPDRLLRHGQTGTIRILRTEHNAVVIPQRATFEILDKQFVYVIGEDNVAHQRLITIANELEDTFVIKDGLKPTDKIVIEGVREVHEGQKVEYEFEKAEEVMKHLKNIAE